MTTQTGQNNIGMESNQQAVSPAETLFVFKKLVACVCVSYNVTCASLRGARKSAVQLCIFRSVGGIGLDCKGFRPCLKAAAANELNH
eukprot:5896839-Amphidinium_carterae.1